MSNAILKRRGEVAHWTRLPAQQQAKARMWAAYLDVPMNQLTGDLLLKAVEKEYARYERNPAHYAMARAIHSGEPAQPTDDINNHWTKLPIMTQNDAKILAKAKGMRLNEFTGNLLSEIIDDKFAQLLAKLNAAAEKG